MRRNAWHRALSLLAAVMMLAAVAAVAALIWKLSRRER